MKVFSGARGVLVFLLSLVLLVFLIFNVLSEPSYDYPRGEVQFNSLSIKYDKYFSIENELGRQVDISKTNPIGRYVVGQFAKKTKVGWIDWSEGNPVINGKHIDSLGQCKISYTGEGVTILLNESYLRLDMSAESFWSTLVFELENAHQAEKFKKLNIRRWNREIDHKEFAEEMLKLEYTSALNTQVFQEKIWVPFCIDNDLPYSEEAWFFPKGSTFEQWKKILTILEGGADYLNAYSIELKASPSSE